MIRKGPSPANPFAIRIALGYFSSVGLPISLAHAHAARYNQPVGRGICVFAQPAPSARQSLFFDILSWRRR
jgi:hypothetical protein